MNDNLQSRAGKNFPAVPDEQRYVVGIGRHGLAALDVSVADTEYLVVAAPTKDDVVLEVPSIVTAVSQAVTSFVGADSVEVQLILKHKNGRTVRMGDTVTVTGAFPDNIKPLGYLTSVFLTSEYDGIYLRVITPSAAGLTLGVAMGTYDTRNVMQKAVELSQQYVQVTPDIPAGRAMFPLIGRADPDDSPFASPDGKLPTGVILNWDTVTHTYGIRVTIQGQVTEFEIPLPTAIDTLGENSFAGPLGPGDKLEVRLLEAVDSVAPFAVTNYGWANLSPVSSKQGGAF